VRAHDQAIAALSVVAETPLNDDVSSRALRLATEVAAALRAAHTT
jgi:hypothetical protein